MVPDASKIAAIFRPSSKVMRSGAASSMTKRMPTTKSSPTRLRIASCTISPKRQRFSTEPPNLSLRRLVAGERNWPMRCAPAKVSMPSMPPSLQRAAASAKSATTRAMSLSSISRAKARCRVSRTGDGPMGASAAPA